jgi:hypothetical protein
VFWLVNSYDVNVVIIHGGNYSLMLQLVQISYATINANQGLSMI